MRAANAASPFIGFHTKPKASRSAQMLSPLALTVYVPVVGFVRRFGGAAHGADVVHVGEHSNRLGVNATG